MSVLYLDLGMGAAGDMLTAALLDLLPDAESFVDRLNKAGIPDVCFQLEKVKKCGVCGSKMNVMIHGVSEDAVHGQDDHESDVHHAHSKQEYHPHSHEHHEHHDGHHVHGAGGHEHLHDGSIAHHHFGMSYIKNVVDNLSVPERVKTDILSVYDLVAKAESEVHGEPVDQIHFHEVGEKDAIADITAVCMLMHELAPKEVIASAVHIGSGTVRCAHGILPVPAPAAALLLKGIPCYSTEIKGELCTPTGAALIRYFVNRFEPMPVMKTTAIGYGMGTKDFARLNCVRAVLGETKDQTDTITQLSCNLDDMTGEEIGYAMQKLLEKGARDVFTIPVMMKKSRPGILLCVICDNDKSEQFARLIFSLTSTIGIRKTVHERYILEREFVQRNTSFGPVQSKISCGYGVEKEKPEFADIERAANEHNYSPSQIKKIIEREQYQNENE